MVRIKVVAVMKTINLKSIKKLDCIKKTKKKKNRALAESFWKLEGRIEGYKVYR